MKIAYEEKVTGEIKRTLRQLEEACMEQGLTMEQALEWWRVAAENEITQKQSFFEKQTLTYRERAEKFVKKYLDGKQKDLSVEILCFLYEQERIPTAEQILDMLSSKLILVGEKRNMRQDICKVLWEFIQKVEEDYNPNTAHYRIKNNWAAVKNRMFNLAKTL